MIVLRRGASRSVAPTIESGKKYLLLYNSYMLNKKISYTFFTVGVIFFMSGCVSTPDSAVETEQIDIEKKKALDQITIESEASHGLSQTIEVSRMVEVEPQVIESRRTTTAAVLGGIIGLLVWGIVWIAVPIWRSIK